MRSNETRAIQNTTAQAATNKLRNILLEVKSSDSYSTSSLDNIDGKYPKLKSHRYVIGSKNLSREERKTTLPIYLLCVLDF